MIKVSLYWKDIDEQKPRLDVNSKHFKEYSVRVLVMTKNGILNFGRYNYKKKTWLVLGENSQKLEIMLWAYVSFPDDKGTKEQKAAWKLYGFRQDKIDN